MRFLKERRRFFSRKRARAAARSAREYAAWLVGERAAAAAVEATASEGEGKGDGTRARLDGDARDGGREDKDEAALRSEAVLAEDGAAGAGSEARRAARRPTAMQVSELTVRSRGGCWAARAIAIAGRGREKIAGESVWFRFGVWRGKTGSRRARDHELITTGGRACTISLIKQIERKVAFSDTLFSKYLKSSCKPLMFAWKLSDAHLLFQGFYVFRRVHG